MPLLRRATFTGLIILLLVLAGTSLLDAITGVEGLSQRVYRSVPVILLWAAVALLAAVYLVRRRVWRMPATALLHAAFLVILLGALTTHLCGEQGTIHIRAERAVGDFLNSDGEYIPMPFALQVDTFIVAYYPGTNAPEDFITRLTILDNGSTLPAQVAMNKILTYRHYRFYQAGYDSDGRGSKLAVAHDPYGIAITYAGYALLLLGMVLFLFQPNSRFRQLLKGKSALVALLLLCLCPTTTYAKNMPKVAPTDIADAFADVYILYNGRVCPVETYARDFCLKLCGKDTYRQRAAAEVLCGWIFFPDTWKKEPMLKLKGTEVQRLLGVSQRYVSIADCANEYGEYKLLPTMEAIYSGEEVKDASNIRAADEKVNILNSLFTTSALKIFPVATVHGEINWYSPVDPLPAELLPAQALFIRTALDHLAEAVVTRQYAQARSIIETIRKYQADVCGDALPTSTERKAEKLYNRMSSSMPWAMLCLTIGILAFIYCAVRAIQQRAQHSIITILLNSIVALLWLYLTLIIVARTIISHHLPLTNGYETMHALAWVALLTTATIQRRSTMALPFGLIISGAALLVSMMGESNPAVTRLMPVLNSPLLAAHVMVIMIAYSLFAFIMLNGITALIFARIKKTMTLQVEQLRRSSELMLYPAVFLLTIGIFIGAIWANVSWGRYWGWDPKETWALITMLVYALPLHSSSIAWFKSAQHFHAYAVAAFLAVVMTYVGANFFLAGLHSYA